jgi:hypothetical protein
VRLGLVRESLNRIGQATRALGPELDIDNLVVQHGCEVKVVIVTTHADPSMWSYGTHRRRIDGPTRSLDRARTIG